MEYNDSYLAFKIDQKSEPLLDSKDTFDSSEPDNEKNLIKINESKIQMINNKQNGSQMVLLIYANKFIWSLIFLFLLYQVLRG